MSVTLTLPSGQKVRSASRRRYVLVSEIFDRTGHGAPSIAIVKRSDSVETLRKARHTRGGPVVATIHHRYMDTIVDTVTKEVVV